jgi:oligosaccharyltransferase complex subunit beta
MKGSRLSVPVALLVTLCLGVGLSRASQQKALVLLEDLALKSTHSLYFKAIADAGFDVTFRRVDDKSLRLREWDDWLYDKLVILAADVAGGGHSIFEGSRM